MDDRSPSMLKPTLIGGGVAGAVASLPLVGALNCLCCSLIIAGGFLAAFLYSKECRAQGVEFGARNAWVVGDQADGYGVILRTHNGGRPWQRQGSPTELAGANL